MRSIFPDWSPGDIAIATARRDRHATTNATWSLLFFGLQWRGIAFAEMLLLWLAIVATLIAFRRVSPAAGWLLAPYLAWVSFAAVLNFMLWRMNS